ncbi:hypothetical protein WJX72_011161 [[Myrmecia] bisecta]|uniref:Translation initiation factor IF-2, mitochondrial n=1 Tax=[Myrmecia] bisecta TaxID=41462 RepID=A0AAW1R9V6_9CHLO
MGSRRQNKASFAPSSPEPSCSQWCQAVYTAWAVVVTVRALAKLLGCELDQLEKVLVDIGDKPSSAEDIVPLDSAELAAMEFGKTAIVSKAARELDADAEPRPAVVTVMGHVDHGKTSLLDALRSTSVAAGEAGGITQHIGAFEVRMPGSQTSLTFLDTPGHAAFSAMRARGAALTDLVVLVVAANDGIMPQTREALAHARHSGCPIVVALSKCDMPGADPARVRRQLMEEGLELEEAGGNVQVVETAAPKGQGLLELEEALLLQADLLDLKASKTRDAEGVVVEARVSKGQGPLATVIVSRGSLEAGQLVVVGSEWGRVRAMRNAAGQLLKQVLPGQPAEIAGLKGVPQAGDELLVVASEERARRVAEARAERAEHQRHLVKQGEVQQAQLEADAQTWNAEEGAGNIPEKRSLTVLIKGDVHGSVEAVEDAIEALASEAVGVKVAFTGVGPVSASDVQMASAMQARIIAFNTRAAHPSVEAQAKRNSVPIMSHRVIYHLLEDIGGWLAGLAPKVATDVVVGQAEVLQVFPLKGKGKSSGAVAGCRVMEERVALQRPFCFLVLVQGNDASTPAATSTGSQGLFGQPIVKAALTSGALSLAGDVLAQLFSRRMEQDKGTLASVQQLDSKRMARMGSFGLVFYGPYQYHWYNLLARHWPQSTTTHFLTKVVLNQLALAPVVLAVVFAWNLGLQRKADQIPSKIKKDLVPTMVNGWKFWVPASSINFWLIPVRHQVLYMSTCGVLWTGYLSYSSNKRTSG